MSTRRISLLAIAIAIALAAGCHASYPGLPTTTPATADVRLFYPFVLSGGTGYVGRVQSINALAVDTDGGYQDVTNQATWSSSNLTVARVVPGGVVTFVNAGTVDIRAAYGGFVGTTTIRVLTADSLPFVNIQVSSDIPFRVGNTGRGSAALVTSNSQSRNITTTGQWRSSDERVATVDTSGLITAVGAGTIDVTATSDGVTGAIRLSVYPRSR